MISCTQNLEEIESLSFEQEMFRDSSFCECMTFLFLRVVNTVVYDDKACDITYADRMFEIL